MGVYIKGMEMPKETYAHCMLVKDINGSVQLHVCTKNGEDISEWEYYDLVPVPPHGDLIDRDELINDMANMIPWAIESPEEIAMVDGLSDGYEAVKDAPTIIPAEEGNGDVE